jgi:hypothetical protein
MIKQVCIYKLMLHEVPQPGVGLLDKSKDWKTCHGSPTHYMEMLSGGEARTRTRAGLHPPVPRCQLSLLVWVADRSTSYGGRCARPAPHQPSRNSGQACCCTGVGHVCPDRKHHLWDCHAAAAVVTELCKCIGVAQLQRRHVADADARPYGANARCCTWQYGSSVRHVMKEVWIVVCLAALQATWLMAKKVMAPNICLELAAQPRGLHAVAAESGIHHCWELLATGGCLGRQNPWLMTTFIAT